MTLPRKQRTAKWSRKKRNWLFRMQLNFLNFAFFSLVLFVCFVLVFQCCQWHERQCNVISFFDPWRTFVQHLLLDLNQSILVSFKGTTIYCCVPDLYFLFCLSEVSQCCIWKSSIVDLMDTCPIASFWAGSPFSTPLSSGRDIVWCPWSCARK